MLVIIRESGTKCVYKEYESFQVYFDIKKECYICRVIDRSFLPSYYDNVVHVEVLENGKKHKFL